MKTFLDSSAFAKRFVDEPGSDEVEDACAQATALGLSVICVPEIVSALNRRRRERSLTEAQYQQAKRQLMDDVRDADIIDLTVPVLATAIHVLETSPIRAMDALHIASALEWDAQLFVSADQKQIQAAQRAGLNTRDV